MSGCSKALSQRKQMTRISPKVFLPTNYQEMDPLEAEVQGLMEAIMKLSSLG